ncbi:ankyrin [Lindgomyces ingoldianus]|uniref:Ankyrin n=1 Tax=Lindgomyces ingoldianus TaxID=673940 RepID=A0ACB6QKA6_9PLEO|nr:ankyrin [Lindgomyces ingoldianus]KAF2466945.1 ankyrin [Lindgomyces ingoldianus]
MNSSSSGPRVGFRRKRKVLRTSSEKAPKSHRNESDEDRDKHAHDSNAGDNEGSLAEEDPDHLSKLLQLVLEFPPEDDTGGVDKDITPFLNSILSSRSSRKGRVSEPPDDDSPTYLRLFQYITNYLIQNDGFRATEAVAQATTPYGGTTLEHIGQGATFAVSRTVIAPGVELTDTVPRRLALSRFHSSDIPNQVRGDDPARIIVYKRPLIQPSLEEEKTSAMETERLAAVLLEIRALTHRPLLHHKNIVDFLGIAWDREVAKYNAATLNSIDLDAYPAFVPVLLLEHAAYGSLADFAETDLYSSLPFNKRASLCRDIAEALYALHQCGIVHGDMKSDNILIFDAHINDEPRMQHGLRAKIADFGFSVSGSAEGFFRLTGGTWLWSDPESDNTEMTWVELQKTDVFSYGLVAWSVLSTKNLEYLFEIDLSDVQSDLNDFKSDSNNLKSEDTKAQTPLEMQVNSVKRFELPSNAASHFYRENGLRKLLIELLFAYSLDGNLNSRSTIDQIVTLWDVWFTGLGYPKYQAMVSEDQKPINFEPISALGNVSINRPFQSIARMAGLLPPSSKQQVVHAIGSLTGESSLRDILFHGFCYATGWGVEQDLNRAKEIIYQLGASDFGYKSAIFRTMFFEASNSEAETRANIYTLYLLRLAQSLGSYEAAHKLIQYFPIPSGYARTRSDYRRAWQYGIYTRPREAIEPKVACQVQTKDIQLQFSLRREIFGIWRQTELHFAVAMGYSEAIDAMVSAQGFDPSLLMLQDLNGDTPLLLAFRLGWYRMVMRLIDAGSNFRISNNYGETAFHFLVEFDQPDEKSHLAEVLFSLLGVEFAQHAKASSHSDLEKEDFKLLPHDDGRPLSRIVRRNDVVLAKVFMKHGVNPAPKEKGLNALDLAASLHCWELLHVFWEFFPHLQEWRSSELLALACRTVRTERMYLHGTRTFESVEKCLGFLVAKMAIPNGNQLQISNAPALHFALHYSADREILQYFISIVSAEDINCYTKAANSEVTAMHLAIQGGSSIIVADLIKKGGSTLLPVRYFGTNAPLTMLEMCAGHQSCSGRILEMIISEHVKHSGSSRIPPKALTCAVAMNNFSAAAMLIKAGVDINGLDDGDTTPLGVVLGRCTADTVQCVRFLMEYPPTVGKPAAAFLVKPKINASVFHSLATIPDRTPFYNRKVLYDTVDYLLEKFGDRAQVNSIGETGYTALHLAASYNPMVVQRLLECPEVDVTIKSTTRGKTAPQLNLEGLVRPVPENFGRHGERVVRQYKKDQIAARNLFAAKCGDEQSRWTGATQLEEFDLGGGRIAPMDDIVVSDMEYSQMKPTSRQWPLCDTERVRILNDNVPCRYLEMAKRGGGESEADGKRMIGTGDDAALVSPPEQPLGSLLSTCGAALFLAARQPLSTGILTKRVRNTAERL